MREQRRHPPRDENKTAAPAQRVLIADDNQDAAQSLGVLLKLWGHEVKIVYDGSSILEAAKSFRPQTALIDIGLPGMNGYEAARQLRSQPEFRNTLLVALTGYGADGDKKRSQEAGFDVHLVKPVGVENLKKMLAENGRN